MESNVYRTPPEVQRIADELESQGIVPKQIVVTALGGSTEFTYVKYGKNWVSTTQIEQLQKRDARMKEYRD